MYSIKEPHSNVTIVTYHGGFDESRWEAYERDFRAIYSRRQATNTRGALVFDVRDISITDMPSIVKFVVLKKDLLVSLKADTCRYFLAAIVLTPYEIIKDIVVNIVRISGQASLFYAFSSDEETLETVDRLVRVINNQTLPKSHPSALSWRNVPPGGITCLLLCFFLRISRHFLARRLIHATATV